MGYNITIGEACIAANVADLHISIDAERAAHDDAPDHDRYVGKGNSRSPSYTAWHEFARDAGIYELFYGQGWCRESRTYLPCSDGFHRETPLLRDHPGAQIICKDDIDFIRRARQRREKTNGGRPPGFTEDDTQDGEAVDQTLARLLWLEFWFDWALKNCKVPVIQNT